MRHPAWFMWERGISVVPVPVPSKKSDGKRPAIRWAPYQNRLPTRSEMQRWFDGESTNYAVITGAVSGIIVVDIDDRSALPWARWNLTPTPWRVDTSRGWHWYYSYVGENVGNRARIAGMKLDVRGDGGYVIGPGSIHSSGSRYRTSDRAGWLAGKASLPIIDASILARAPMREVPQAPRQGGPMVERARQYLSRIPAPIEGYGSDGATFVAACRLVRGFGLTADQAVGLLSEWAPPFDTWWLRSKVSAALKYGSEITGSKL